jgi:hypothetical protein
MKGKRSMYQLTLTTNADGMTVTRYIPIFRSYDQLVELLDYYAGKLCLYYHQCVLVGDGEFRVQGTHIFLHYRIVAA